MLIRYNELLADMFPFQLCHEDRAVMLDMRSMLFLILDNSQLEQYFSQLSDDKNAEKCTFNLDVKISGDGLLSTQSIVGSVDRGVTTLSIVSLSGNVKEKNFYSSKTLLPVGSFAGKENVVLASESMKQFKGQIKSLQENGIVNLLNTSLLHILFRS
jgi:hypothetical protein